MKRKLRIGMSGLGRTGREIAKAILNEPDLDLVMALCSKHNPNLGQDISNILGTMPTGVKLESSEHLAANLSQHKPDVVIDFSTPEAVMNNIKAFAQNKVCVVIGTTGFSEMQVQRLYAIAAKYHVGIVYAPNITLGVNVLMSLVNLAATLLEDYDCSIVETHFKKKKDAPSGTAKKIADQITKGIEARNHNSTVEEVPIHAIRTGGVIGQHKVIMAGEYDKVEITHESFSRKAFAAGALKAARFVNGKSGYFEMRDVLDLENVLANYVKRSTPQHIPAGKNIQLISGESS